MSTGMRSRAATFATDQTDFSHTQLPERQLAGNLTDIAAEIIGPIRSSVTMNATRNSSKRKGMYDSGSRLGQWVLRLNVCICMYALTFGF